jgi:hypothetical protein
MGDPYFSSVLAWTTANLNLSITAVVALILWMALVYNRRRRLRCPRCGRGAVRRSHRENLWEKILSTIPIHPYRCNDCGHRFKRLR